MAKKSFEVPIDANGNMIGWQSPYAKAHRPVTIWADVLYYQGYERGRSAVNFKWSSIYTHRRYYMFLTDMDEVLKETGVEDGTIKGQFTYVKRGKNFGIKRVDALPPMSYKGSLGEK